jgi:hypothetical protein
MGAREKYRKQRRFYLDGYAQHPESFTWHYEMLRKLKDIDNNTSSSLSISFDDTATDAFGRLRVSNPFTLFDSNSRYGYNEDWSRVETGSISFAYNADEGLEELNVDATGIGWGIKRTKKYFPYQPGKSLLVLNTFVFGTAQADLTQRVGYYDNDNGLFVQLTDTLSFVKRTNISGTPADVVVNQADWNVDKLDGNGPSGYTFDSTKAQIFWMDIEWLGVGTVRMGFVIDGKFIVCHKFDHANIITGTYMTTATLPCTYEMQANTAVSATTLKAICSTVISEGGYELFGEKQTAHTDIATPTSFAVANTYYPVVAVSLKSGNLGGTALITNISMVGLGNGKYYNWRLKEVVSTGITGGSWSGSGIIEANTTATSVTGGSIVASGFTSSSNQGSPVITLDKSSLFGLQFKSQNIPEFSIENSIGYVLEAAVSTTSGGEGVYGSIDWQEVVR